MLKIATATLLLSAVFASGACKSRDSGGSDLRSASVSTCTTQKVDAKDLNNIIISFPAECLAAQIKATLTDNIDALNANHPKYYSGLEFRAVDANVAMTSDEISLDGEVIIQNNLVVFNVKDTVDYRIKVDGKEPRYGEAWKGLLYKVEILVKDWGAVQNIKFSRPDLPFGAANEDDRKRINAADQFFSTMDKNAFNMKLADSLAAKMKPGMAAGLLEAIKVDPSVKSLMPPEYSSAKLNEAYIATGAIENNALVLKLTPRKAAAAPK